MKNKINNDMCTTKLKSFMIFLDEKNYYEANTMTAYRQLLNPNEDTKKGSFVILFWHFGNRLGHRYYYKGPSLTLLPHYFKGSYENFWVSVHFDQTFWIF